MGGIYTPTGVGGRGGKHAWTHVSTLLWTPLFCHRGVNTQTHSDSCKHKEDPQLYCVTYTSVVKLYVGGGGGSVDFHMSMWVYYRKGRHENAVQW